MKTMKVVLRYFFQKSKKLFISKPSTSKKVVAPLESKENSHENGVEDARKSRSKKAAAFKDANKIQTIRRVSSGTFYDSDSACSSSSNVSHKQSTPGSSCLSLTPERYSRRKWCEDDTSGVDKVSVLESSSYCSTNASNKNLEKGNTKKHNNSNSNTKTHHLSHNTEGGGGLTQKPRSHSPKNRRESKVYMCTKDWVEYVHGHRSPKRLSQSRVSKDMYGGHCHVDDELDEVCLLEEELDRQSTEWSKKLEQYQMEEQRLRKRVRELAEENMSLQREVSLYGEKELESERRVMKSGQQVKDLSLRMEEVISENEKLHGDISELKDRYRGAEEDRDCFKRYYSDKDKECKELHKTVARLFRTCNEQEKTIDGLRKSKDDFDFDFDVDFDRSKLETQQFRLTGVEQGLRKEDNLKAEVLMTSLLREKLYTKEVEVEQLEAELATAVRGNEILKCQVENAMDTISCVTHRMKELEMHAIKKDEGIYLLQHSLQECKKELSVVKGILPKIAEERDMMFEEVQKYSENKMLLNLENEMLKKKVEDLDEDVMMKEGQITILKDALANQPFDLLSSSPNCSCRRLFCQCL